MAVGTSRLHLPFREECGYVKLRIDDWRVVGRVGIVYVVLAEDYGECVLFVDDYSAAELHVVCKPFIPHCHAVEIRPLVERYQSVLSHLVAANGGSIIYKVYGEAQGSVVENLMAAEAVWIANAVAHHQRGCSTAQRCTHLIRVEAAAVVVVIGDGAVE